MTCHYCAQNQGRGCPKCEGTLDEPIRQPNIIAVLVIAVSPILVAWGLVKLAEVLVGG